MIVHQIQDGAPRTALAEMRAKRDARAEVFAGLFRSGKTLQEIGDRHGLTRERVRQLIARTGTTRVQGGHSIAAAARTFSKARKKADKLDRWNDRVGCSQRDALELNGGKSLWTIGSPCRGFFDQKRNAAVRGIEWNLSFPEWLSIWRASGKLDERGRGYGYVMARWGDSGGYCAANVHIITGAQNASDSFLVHPVAERIAKRSKQTRSRGYWVSFDKRRKSLTHPFALCVWGKYYGMFATRADAEAKGRIASEELRPDVFGQAA